MPFNSSIYLFYFLPAAAGFYFLFHFLRFSLGARVWLILVSLVFYAWSGLSHLPVLAASIVVNFFLARETLRLPKESRHRRWVFISSLLFNLSLLGSFKYSDFLLSNINQVLGTSFPLLGLVLPLGVSFFTLQQIAFQVDTYENLVSERNPIDYLLFVSFFPQLVSGPIVHHRETMPQFREAGNAYPSLNNCAAGLLVLFVGIVKKVVIADRLAPYVYQGFDSPYPLTLLDAWLSSWAFTFQLYFDFSGYTDMAIGSALLFNIRLPINFDSPLRSKSIIEFWSRWHMTLTHFLTTYIYTPIFRSFKRRTFAKSLAAVFVTFLVSGIWHGAGWTFVFFGVGHGFGLLVNHLWRRRKLPMPAFWGWLLTFNFVNISFTLFRARSPREFLRVIQGMFGLNGVALPTSLESQLAFLRPLGVRFAVLPLSTQAYLQLCLMLLVSLGIVMRLRNSVALGDTLREYLR
jgi:alginate O-acetyltransferase complex protein AlgI